MDYLLATAASFEPRTGKSDGPLPPQARAHKTLGELLSVRGRGRALSLVKLEGPAPAA